MEKRIASVSYKDRGSSTYIIVLQETAVQLKTKKKLPGDVYLVTRSFFFVCVCVCVSSFLISLTISCGVKFWHYLSNDIMESLQNKDQTTTTNILLHT